MPFSLFPEMDNVFVLFHQFIAALSALNILWFSGLFVCVQLPSSFKACSIRSVNSVGLPKNLQHSFPVLGQVLKVTLIINEVLSSLTE